MALNVRRIINSPIDSNCYIIFDKQVSNECIIVDPGSESNEMLVSEIKTLQLKPRYIILTHEHYDHCWGVNELKNRYPNAELVCSLECSEAIRDPRRNYSHYRCNKEFVINKADILLEGIGWNIKWEGNNLIFKPSKGHSSSGIFIILGDALFSGDTLIKDVRTVTQFKTGSKEELKSSLEYLLSCKGNNYTIYPGHGETFLLDKYDLSIAEKG